jgi:hypothetical protein
MKKSQEIAKKISSKQRMLPIDTCRVEETIFNFDYCRDKFPVDLLHTKYSFYIYGSRIGLYVFYNGLFTVMKLHKNVYNTY